MCPYSEGRDRKWSIGNKTKWRSINRSRRQHIGVRFIFIQYIAVVIEIYELIFVVNQILTVSNPSQFLLNFELSS